MQAMQRKVLQEAAAYTCIHMHSKPPQVQGEAHAFRQGGGRVCDRPLRMHTHAEAAAYTCIALATRFNRLRTNALAVARHTVSQAALLASKGACIRAHSPSTLRAHSPSTSASLIAALPYGLIAALPQPPSYSGSTSAFLIYQRLSHTSSGSRI